MLDTSTQLRLTGLATGLDTDAIIQQLGKAYNVRINAVKKDKQLLLWRQESYRSTINMVSTMLKSNFNAANPASNLRSANSFAKFSYNLSLGGSITDAAKAKVSSIVSVTANGDLKKFNQTIESVAQLASKDTWKGDKIDIAGITTKWKGGDGFNIEDLVKRDANGDVTSASYTSFALSIDGVSRTIMVDGVEAKRIADMDKDTGIDPADLKGLQAQEYAKALNADIVRQFGKDYAGVVSVNDKNEITFRKAGSTLTINGSFGFDNIMTTMGLKGGATSAVSQKQIGEALDLGDLFKNGSKATIKINDREIDISETDTINSVMTKINNSGAGVNLSYDSAGDRFVLTSSQEGSANGIKDITGNAAKFFEAMGIGKAVEIGGGAVSGGKLTKLVTSLDEVRDMLETEDDIDITVDISGVKHTFSKGQMGGSTILAESLMDGDGVLVQENLTNTLTYPEAIDYIINKIGNVSGTREEGKNLIAMINGEKYTRQSNTFTHEGMTFKFTETFNVGRYNFDEGAFSAVASSDLDPAIKIQVDKNTAEVVTSIKAFVEEYNKLIDHINGLLTEKRDRSYKPLTDDEKKAMTEEEVTVYEAQAKSGIMANDSELRKLLDQMRSSIYQRVDGIGLTMSEIGITTSPNWKDGGRLVIDEGTLSNAIENRYDDVVALFTKPEVKIPEERDEKGNIIKKAYIEKQGGVALRLYNVLNDAAGLTGDKGYLVQKAGVANDGSQMQNQMQKQLTQYDKRLDTLLERWYRKESQYYKMFAKMESAMMKMQSQQNSLASLAAQGGK